MKEQILKIIEEYLLIFPKEKERQNPFLNYLNQSSEKQIIDWNNFDGHVVAGGIIYTKKDKKILMLYHNDLKMFLFPGGHIDSDDTNPLETAIREIKEETGLENLIELKVTNNQLIPLDIDMQKVGYNDRLNLPAHYHFVFLYLFMIDKATDIQIDTEELSEYQWIDFEKFSKNKNYEWLTDKMNILLNRYKNK